MLAAPGVFSLKEKRSVLRRIKDRTANKFRVSIAEVGMQDVHAKAIVGFAVVSSSAGHAEAMVDNIVRSIANIGLAEIVGDDREVLQFEDIDFAGADPDDWMSEKYR